MDTPIFTIYAVRDFIEFFKRISQIVPRQALCEIAERKSRSLDSRSVRKLTSRFARDDNFWGGARLRRRSIKPQQRTG